MASAAGERSPASLGRMDRATALRQRFYPESAMGGFADVDGTLAFYLRVGELLPPDGFAVDVGCGRGTQGEDPVRLRRQLRILRGRCRRVVGVDVDPVAAANPFVDEFRLIDDPGRWPIDSGAADLCLADFVLEHVEEPDAFLGECARVLRPGGHLCIRTVNAWSYLGLGSRLVPNRGHGRLLERLQPARSTGDVFPTRYRCNSLRRLRRALDRHDFDAVVYGYDAEPAYLAFSSLAYRLGVLHGRYAPTALRTGLFAFARRRALSGA